MTDYDPTKNNSISEYESDGNIFTYSTSGIGGGIYDAKTDSYVKVRKATQPEPSSSKRPATWLDVIQPDGKPLEPSPWTPPALSQLERKALGKLGEETNELSTVLFRIHIQGLDEKIPGETKTNRQWLEEEIADSIATQGLVIEHFKLDYNFIEERVKKKTTYLEKWYMTPDIDKDAQID